VLKMAPFFDVVILGGAVANLIPVCYHREPKNEDENRRVLDAGLYDFIEEPLPLTGKFPSHDYEPGDIIRMDWTIAPRVIDEVKALMKPGAHLFGFKLLGGAEHDELISAAYETLLGSKATMVFANDATDLQKVYAVGKDRSEHPFPREELCSRILELCEDEYYRTEAAEGVHWTERAHEDALDKIHSCVDKNRMLVTPEGYVFGTVAIRISTDDGNKYRFITTARGKNELSEAVCVVDVDHEKRVVYTVGGKKASLNAPLLHKLFTEGKWIPKFIEHYHDQVDGLATEPYAPPGTVRDSVRPSRETNNLVRFSEEKGWSFNIEGHGCFLLFDCEGHQL